MRYDALRMAIESFGDRANDVPEKVIIRRAKAFDKFMSKDVRYNLKDSDATGETSAQSDVSYDAGPDGAIHHTDPEVQWDVVTGQESAFRVKAAWNEALDAVLALGAAFRPDEEVRVKDIRESIESLRKVTPVDTIFPEAGTTLE